MTIEQELSKEECAEREPEEKKEKRENIEKISETLEKVGKVLNKNKVEYYVGGGIAVYLLAGKKLEGGEHDDIDIYVPEEEITKLKQSLKEGKFDFWDDRFAYRDMRPEEANERGELRIRRHACGACDPETRVIIGFLPYEITDEGDFVSKDHYGRVDKNGKIVGVVEKTVVPAEMRAEELFFDKEKHGFKNTELSTVSPEYIYLRKAKAPREKDKRDLELIKPHIDPTKVEKIKKLIPRVRRFRIIGGRIKEITEAITKI